MKLLRLQMLFIVTTILLSSNSIALNLNVDQISYFEREHVDIYDQGLSEEQKVAIKYLADTHNDIQALSKLSKQYIFDGNHELALYYLWKSFDNGDVSALSIIAKVIRLQQTEYTRNNHAQLYEKLRQANAKLSPRHSLFALNAKLKVLSEHPDIFSAKEAKDILNLFKRSCSDECDTMSTLLLGKYYEASNDIEAAKQAYSEIKKSNSYAYRYVLDLYTNETEFILEFHEENKNAPNKVSVSTKKLQANKLMSNNLDTLAAFWFYHAQLAQPQDIESIAQIIKILKRSPSVKETINNVHLEQFAASTINEFDYRTLITKESSINSAQGSIVTLLETYLIAPEYFDNVDIGALLDSFEQTCERQALEVPCSESVYHAFHYQQGGEVELANSLYKKNIPFYDEAINLLANNVPEAIKHVYLVDTINSYKDSSQELSALVQLNFGNLLLGISSENKKHNALLNQEVQLLGMDEEQAKKYIKENEKGVFKSKVAYWFSESLKQDEKLALDDYINFMLTFSEQHDFETINTHIEKLKSTQPNAAKTYLARLNMMVDWPEANAETAYQLLQELVQAKYSKAYNILGKFYASGLAGDKNISKSIYYYNLAQIHGNVGIDNTLADTFLGHRGICKNKVYSYSFYQLAKINGSTEKNSAIESLVLTPEELKESEQFITDLTLYRVNLLAYTNQMAGAQ